MAYRKTMKFTDVTSKYSGPDRMDFTEWLEKAEHAFQVMGLQDAKEKVEIFPVYPLVAYVTHRSCSRCPPSAPGES